MITAIPLWREIRFGNKQSGWAAKKFLQPAAAPSPPDVTSTVAIPANAFLEIHFVDVGQGDAIWIQTHDDGVDGNGKFEGYSIGIDGGPYSSDATNPLRPYMENHGHHGASVEALIVTHPHMDHYSGAETIARHFDVQHYYDPGFPGTRSSYKHFIDELRGTGPRPLAHITSTSVTSVT